MQTKSLCSCLSQGELDELEREEFFRLKKVQSNKKKHAEAAAAQQAHMEVRAPAGRTAGFWAWWAWRRLGAWAWCLCLGVVGAQRLSCG